MIKFPAKHKTPFAPERNANTKAPRFAARALLSFALTLGLMPAVALAEQPETSELWQPNTIATSIPLELNIAQNVDLSTNPYYYFTPMEPGEYTLKIITEGSS